MDSPSTPKNKRSFPNESPRTQRTCVEKNQIIDYYNSIKEIYGAKAKTVKKFELKSTSDLSRILGSEATNKDLREVKKSKDRVIDVMKAMIAIKNFLKKDMQPALLCFLDAEKVIIESIEASKKQTKLTSYFGKL